MVVTELQIENWKCITKSKDKFEMQNIINRPNGTGKSSLFQAIIFGLFGKMPPGFNLNTLRKDQSQPCKILVKFKYKEDEYESYRQFGKSSYVAVKKNGQTMCNSSKEAFAYIDKILPYNIISVLWAPNTLSSSDILKPNFLVDHLLEYIFEDPKYLLKHYKYELFGQNKIVRNIEMKLGKQDNIQEMLKQKENEIHCLKLELKERSNFNDKHANIASVAKSAQELINSKEWPNILDKSDLSKFLSILGKNDQEKLKMELEERLGKEENKKDTLLMQLHPSSLRLIKQHSEKSHECLICKNKIQNKEIEEIQEIINNPNSRNQELIDSLKEKIEILSTDSNIVKKSQEYYRLQEQIDSCKDWENILSQYDEENNKMWRKLEKLQKQKEEYQRQVDLNKDYIIESEKSKKLSYRANIISMYIKEASEYYSKTLTQEASSILASLNPRYDQIFLEDSQYKVSVISSDMSSIDLLPAVQLSSGEKTLIGVSLILSAHKLFFPYVPLLFDESFSALDKENVYELKKIFDNSRYQLFIITHDKYWIES